MICKDLEEVRDNIDKIDEEIVKLIVKRSNYVMQATNFKKHSDDVKATPRV
jgi:isochorismate pyruvate lyase